MGDQKSVILVGATGHIGAWVHRRLIENDFLVTACSRHERTLPAEMVPNTTWVTIDLSDPTSVKKAFATRHHDFFIHLASEKVVGKAESDPASAIETNVCGTAHVLAAAAEAGVTNGLFASSWAVYAPNDQVGRSYKESDELVPANVYGLTKKIGEELCGSYKRSGRIPNLSILRLFNGAGGPAYEGASEQAGFFHYVAKAVREGSVLTISGNDFPTKDGTCERDFIDVRDVADLMVSLVSKETSGIFNIGSGQAVSLEEVVKAFEAVSGKTIKRQGTARRPGDPVYVAADITEAKSVINFAPTHNLSDVVTSSLNL